jgi:hypothetical protein
MLGGSRIRCASTEARGGLLLPGTTLLRRDPAPPSRDGVPRAAPAAALTLGAPGVMGSLIEL